MKKLSLVLALVLAACGGEDTKPRSVTDAGQSDVDADLDATTAPDTADVGIDTSTPDMTTDSSTPDMTGFGRTLPDYRRCQSDADCPVGLGSCVKEIPLNRPNADGKDRYVISEVFADLNPGEGVCSLACTVNEAVCSALSVNGIAPDAEPYVCQVVVIGDSPYPAAPPAFPFDDTLNPLNLIAGTPFGAICRPPFQLDQEVDRGFCAPCVGGPDACGGTALCFDYLSQSESADGQPGECLGVCNAGACPLGFECSDIAGTDRCVPQSGTCTSCVDHDRDLHGAGRCGTSNQPVSEVDCDDRNPDAYYSATDPDHAFPTFCDPSNDFNCNGKSDADEQIGTALFGSSHCGTCFDACGGPVLNGNLSCIQNTCRAMCVGAFATCDDDELNGCEQSATAEDLTYYADADNDGFGDPAVTQFACTAGQPPAGFVIDNTDCNDTSPLAKPGGTETCDGLDNDCDGDTDEPTFGVGISCTATASVGECRNGTTLCGGVAGLVCEPSTPTPETCNGLDDDCDGGIDTSNNIAPAAAPLWYPDCDKDNYGLVNSASRRSCFKPTTAPTSCPNGGWSAVNTDCDDTNATIHPNQPENCATPADDNCVTNDPSSNWANATTYYEDKDGDSYSPSPTITQLGCGAAPQFGWTPKVTANTQADCNDNNGQINPGAAEVCTTPYDDNCNNQSHDATVGRVTRYRDQDLDGYGVASSMFCQQSMSAAEQNTYNAMQGGDCYDSLTNKTVSSNGHVYNGPDQNPGKSEVCDGYDNDCDGSIDNGCPDDYTLTNNRIDPDIIGFTVGGTKYSRHCEANEVMTGMRVISVDQLGTCQVDGGVKGVAPTCANPNISTNTNDDPFTFSQTFSSSATDSLTGSYGTVGGFCGHMKEDTYMTCAGNAVVTGLYGRDGSRIDRIGLTCKALNLNYAFTPATLTFGGAAQGSLKPDNFNGGGDFNEGCANNEVATGFDSWVKDGIVVAMKLRCTDIDLLNY